MGYSKTEVKLRRLLASAPKQQNQAKLIHFNLAVCCYFTGTIRTIGCRDYSRRLTKLSAYSHMCTHIHIISKVMVNDYSEKIEAIASKLAVTPPDILCSLESVNITPANESSTRKEGTHIPSSPGLRRRFVPLVEVEDRSHEAIENDGTMPVKLDAMAQAHIEKHRKLQEDLTDEMVGLARQLKESSLTMNRSLQETEKILDSTEKAVEHSLASTGRANTRAMEVYSESFKTTCFTWLVMFIMTCIFIMVVLLIRVT